MKVAIFEGPEVSRPNGRWTWKEGQELPDYTPGERKCFPGWRNYLVMMWPEGFPVQTHSTMGNPNGTARLCNLLRARFYPEGTWEDGPPLPGQLPKVRAAVLAEILGKPQPELAL